MIGICTYLASYCKIKGANPIDVGTYSTYIQVLVSEYLVHHVIGR